MLTYFPDIYPDELLYSLFGRLRCHSGILRHFHFLDDAFGSRLVSIGFFLQANLERLAANIPPSRGLTARRLALETTLLPYLTAYRSQDVRELALASLTEEKGKVQGMYFRLGLATYSAVHLPSALRYCLTCRAEMLDRYGELYWRRDHQVPGVLVCPIHGTPLADSLVTRAKTKHYETHFADIKNCPADPAPPIWGENPEVVTLLHKIAKCSTTLLNFPPDARSLAAWREESQLALRARGLGRGRSGIDQTALLDAYLTRFGPILEFFPDAVPNKWLERIAHMHHSTLAPLRHILINLLIESLPIAKKSDPFGPGPWLCRNPLAEHQNQPVITTCETHKAGDKIIGVFRCPCGYAFSTAFEQGKRVKVLAFGPLFNARLCELIGTGMNLSNIARALYVDRNTVRRYCTLQGLETHWKARPLYTKLPPIHREEMRAAWANEHAAAPYLSRAQLRRAIPRVYTWLYCHDHAWLGAQPPVAIPPKAKNPRFDWSDTDAAMEEAIRQECAQLRAQTPLKRISQCALNSALGQKNWLSSRLHKLPRCSIALAELTESVDDFRCRRIVWEAEVLRQQGIVVSLARLRKLAGLPNHCSPAVEGMLMEVVKDL